MVLAFAHTLAVLTETQLPIVLAALAQGTVAAMITRYASLAPWWPGIQFVFPVALVTFGALQLPSWIFLVAFLLLLCLYWTTFRTQVPYYPSSRQAWEAVNALLPVGRALRVIDIGSGFGGFAMHLAQARPESEVTGIELAPLPWLASAMRARFRRSRARFIRGDYEKLDLACYDVVFAYLSPAAMPSLWCKAKSEMRAGALLLSHEFPIPGMAPDITVHPVGSGPALYGWRIC
ncbi:MAG TPA: class I SAM-dependent methyltransferase [Noviherbaspirillum sp.]|uniref:class I SAM-dependent methyltransferase n=1 Tax=Noviherbaspirillum sp. TaxID=1926288 RepID=UPI002D3D23D9|nr:class I SAM-dependent methyltransferase [Noviherbaspirillum sp.]HYD96932.1 class I SAM-dependent methyltransferase [Noviherbaspirillum sp.]